MSLAIAYKMKKKKSRHKSDPSKEKGVHQYAKNALTGESHPRSESEAGKWANSAHVMKDAYRAHDLGKAKDEHEKVLEEMREMRGKDRKYLSEGGEITDREIDDAEEGDYQKGVHRESRYTFGGKSEVGDAIRGKNAGHPSQMYKDPKEEHLKILGEMKSMKKPHLYAEGGDVQSACENCGHTPSSMVDPTENEDNDDMDMIDSIMSKRYAKGGDVKHKVKSTDMKEHDDAHKHGEETEHRVDNILRGGSKHKGHFYYMGKVNEGPKKIKMSEGGMIANDTDFSADKEDAEYDDLVKRDELEFSYDGENSGDEEGNEQVEEDEKDVVSQIMKSRKKKDKMPRPA